MQEEYNMGDDLDFYIENQASLIEKYNEKYIAIRNGEVFGPFNDIDSAIAGMKKNGFDTGQYLVQLVSKGKESYTTILSRTQYA
ncbi:hypothetical protein IJ103_04200 [Candidatus Saccharibacteria bacterium]|nr:hypothetical protein [Candidatus Saccharibacteria bacterium]